MNLLLLQLEGFTSFREPATLDLADAELFAITGPTGAGKSSLLDAVTYALFGRVERVGKEVGELISQNRPALKVLLTFEVSGARYRVMRRRPRKGAAQIVLERATSDATWESACDGSDRVEPVNAKIEELLGVDYDGFTRAVILPQGRFAEFLTGNRTQRRDILTKLLGLQRIESLGVAARERGKTFRAEAGARTDLIEHSFADATTAALDARAAELETMRTRSITMEALGDQLGRIASRARELGDHRAKLDRLADDLGKLLEELASAQAERRALDDALGKARVRSETAVADEGHAATAHAAALSALDDHRRARGDDETLDQLRTTAAEFANAQRLLADLTDRVAEAERLAIETSGTLSAATSAATDRATTLDAAKVALTAAETRLEVACRTDHAAAACEGLHEGDACPICATPLTTLPAPSSAAAEAKKVLDAAKRAIEDGQRTAAASDAAVASFTERLTMQTRQRSTLEGELVAARTTLDRLQAALAAVFADADPTDLALQVERAVLERRRLLDRERAASDQMAAAATARVTAAAALEQLELRLDGLRRRDGELRDPRRLASLDLVATAPPGSLDDAFIADLRPRLERARASDTDADRELGDEARRIVGDTLGAFETVTEAIQRLEAARKDAERAIGGLEQDCRSLEKRIGERTALAAEVEDLGRRADRFTLLGTLLKGNEFVAWLQEDALRALCHAGTEHLRRLSSDRYRLELDADKDEFIVHDTWNGDEPRSARTLSGGETFLASLSLALSLADEVERLRIGAGARLESLFLDEGFGTLDDESLEEVVQALSRLAASGRSVGIITHLERLASQMPIRFEVTKQQSGSTVQLVT